MARAATALFALALLALAGSAAAQNKGPFPTFMAALNANTALFSEISTALNKAGLTNYFSSNRAITVFVPTNQAFQKVYQATNMNMNSLTPSLLRQIIYYHVVMSPMTTQQIAQKSTLSTGLTLQGRPATLSVTNGGKTLKGIGSSANIIMNMANIKAGSGYAHAVDAVLLPIRVGR